MHRVVSSPAHSWLLAGSRMRHPLGVAALMLAIMIMAAPAGAQFQQQGPKLVSSSAVGAANQGFSVAVSGDGNTAVVGGPNDDSSAGAAWVWARNNGAWTQSAKLVGAGAVGAAQQAGAVAVSADGTTAVVSGNADNGTAGAVWVWTRSGGVWSQQGAKLVGTGATGVANQGNFVAVSADGNTAVVAGFNDNSGAGAVWVWTRTGGVWSQQGAKLVGTGAVGHARQGVSVAVSGDGNTIIAGGHTDNGNNGAAWVWTRSGGVWSQQGAKLVGTGAVGIASQGFSVALSADGNTAVVGGLNDNGGPGAVWVWTRSGGVWSQQGAKLVGTGAVGPAGQGYSVALSADGTTAVVGGYHDSFSAGAVWVFGPAGPVAVNERPAAARSPEFAAPYPNPAALVTNFEFRLPISALVHAEVFDLAGQRIRSLIGGQYMAAGEHRAEWDGRDASGHQVAAGIYEVRISTGPTEAVRKVVLIR
jgi:hypothetical protein